MQRSTLKAAGRPCEDVRGEEPMLPSRGEPLWGMPTSFSKLRGVLLAKGS